MCLFVVNIEYLFVQASDLQQRSQAHQQRFLLGGDNNPPPTDDGQGSLPENWGEVNQ